LPSQVVYDLTEKNDSSLGLIEKNIAENDLVYVLTEIDSGRLRSVAMANDLDEARATVDLVAEDLAKVTGLGSEDFLKDRRVGELGKDVGNFAPCLAELRRDARDKDGRLVHIPVTN
jgi:hypothetical protein